MKVEYEQWMQHCIKAIGFFFVKLYTQKEKQTRVTNYSQFNLTLLR